MKKPLIKSSAIIITVFLTLNCAPTANVAPTETSSNAAETANQIVEEKAVAAGNGEAQQNAPDALLRDLYKTREQDFKDNKDRILNGEDRKNLDKYFDKTLADYIWKDLTTHRDEVGVLDFDPFYNAQDADIKKLNVGQPKISGEKATVVVTFENSGRKETLTYELARRAAAWKISDIKYPENQSLLGYFKEAEKASKNETGENLFSGNYQVGDTTCAVSPVKMAFEVKWAKGSGVMMFFFEGDEAGGKYVFSSEDTGKGRDAFVFDDDTFTKGKFIRADGREMPVRKIQ